MSSGYGAYPPKDDQGFCIADLCWVWILTSHGEVIDFQWGSDMIQTDTVVH
jgi:hypothetical protein